MSNGDYIESQHKLTVLHLYSQQNLYFTGNPEYSLFDSHTRFKDSRDSQDITNKNNKYYRHTHFITDNYSLNSDSNGFNLYTKDNAIEIIYDLIIESDEIPELVKLCCNNLDYTIIIDTSDTSFINNKYYTKIPLKRYNIDYINLGFDYVTDRSYSYGFKKTILQIKYNKEHNKTIPKNTILHIYGVILDSEERRSLYHYLPYYNYPNKKKDFTNTHINTEKKIISLHDGQFIFTNTQMQNVHIETTILPEKINIEHGSIHETLSIDDLLFYNKLYDDTITKDNDKFLIKIPILFNQSLLAIDGLNIKINVHYKDNKPNLTTIIYDIPIMSNKELDLLDDTINKKKYNSYNIIKYLKHKKINLRDIKEEYLNLDDFSFPLKYLLFTGNFTKEIKLKFGTYIVKYDTVNTRITNHISLFGKILNDYNLISFCVDNTDFSGEFINYEYYTFNLKLDSFESETINNEDNKHDRYIDIYGIGYKIIEYMYDENGKLNCYYKFKFGNC